MTFTGFPVRPQATAIPNVFFTDLLPLLTRPGEVIVALCAFRALSSKKGFPRYITRGDIMQEPSLAALGTVAAGPAPKGGDRPSETPKLQNNSATNASESPVDRALLRLAEIGMLLPLTVERGGQRIDLYFLNAPADRRGLEAVRSGSVDIGVIPRARPEADTPQRSGIFALYESLVGTISPLIADELTEAERLYPEAWLTAAFREAAAQNARSWRYVSRILERWAVEGPDHATIERSAAGVSAQGDDRYFRGKYGKILKQRLQP
jgi:DnaD/phage-associated family protein